MLNLREYRDSADRLADHVPWAALVAPGVVLNKDGGFQRTFRFRGPDLESATDAELVAVCARANNALRRLGSGWALFFDAERAPALGYPDSAFPDAASWLVDEERRGGFDGRRGELFESRCHLTFFYLPPADQVSRAERMLIERETGQTGRDWRQELAAFVAQTDRILDLLAGFMPQIRPLDDVETLTFLHAAVSAKRHRVAVPPTPMYLDGLLVDTPLSGGMEPRLGERRLRTLTVLGFPNTTRPGLLDALNHQGFAYRWSTRFIALDKPAAAKALGRIRRQWFNKRKSVVQILREVISNEPAPLTDSDADNQLADADLALQELGGDHVAFGFLTTTITVVDADRDAAEEKVRQVERVLGGLGFTCIREQVNAVESWLGSLPGQVYANVRQPLVHTLNLAHLMPLSAVWAGQAGNPHLKGPATFYAVTSGSTPFRYATHVDDVGHQLLAGPTGAGKSVLLALLALQFRRYDEAQVYVFDKRFSSRAAVLAMGGRHHGLAADAGLAFQPLRRIDQPGERAWAIDWLGDLLAGENLVVTPQTKEALWSALGSLASAPAAERTLTGLSMLLQSNALKAALAPYTLDGPFGRLLDAAEDGLDLSDVQCFETETLIKTPSVVAPVLTYLFHRLEARFDGRPTLLVLDEAWKFLDTPLFAARIREWLKDLRKRNVAVVFATQSLADITDSPIAPAIIDGCPQRVFLANDRAIEPLSRKAYAGFGLNDRQIELIARATPKRHYYLQSRLGNRLFELGLGPVALALCGASDPAVQTLIDKVLADHGQADFAAGFLAARGLPWAASLIADFVPPQTHKESAP
ncbi:conjugal transfer protein TrbE [Caulobacter sp. Root1455]|uniref:conjugal transfer protein TrbE n=1 Tax=Caulobacter sp. Root1455 TaxID=1736465 RepID=UPI0006F3D978|nr:conjugal transfer protein TrbE [Caulobacter sp. Root1455]KQY91827.1 conjugal transfer protein TrbE [Caulobacter sp. Root1455]